jgi:site-specific DNA-methyltransferase (adenine-specific)
MENNTISQVTNEDCMQFMSRYPDKYFELAIVDPPYGINRDGHYQKTHHRKNYTKKGWDSQIPNKEYFDELFRVSKNQIIWGSNYFTEHLPSSMGWIVWDKGQRDLTMSDGLKLCLELKLVIMVVFYIQHKSQSNFTNGS